MGVLQESCAKCGHSFSFHGKSAKGRCKANGCYAGPRGKACTGFKAKKGASKELRDALSATR
jgi:hypothetical protein